MLNLIFSAVSLLLQSRLCLKASRQGHLLHCQISPVPDVPQIQVTCTDSKTDILICRDSPYIASKGRLKKTDQPTSVFVCRFLLVVGGQLTVPTRLVDASTILSFAFLGAATIRVTTLQIHLTKKLLKCFLFVLI